MKRIYLDYNATTPLDSRVLDEMIPYLKNNYGNPSSIHSYGNKAKAALDESRDRVSDFIRARPGEIVFTGGGSESNNFAIKGSAFSLREKGNHLITVSTEHASCLEVFRFLEKRGFEVTYVSVDKFGLVNLDELQNSIKSNTILISCMYVNNETGVINPINKIGEIAGENNILFHSDMVQAAGKIEIDISALPLDLASFSSHKIYGPKGVGALY
ncbi:MAG: cysteine desulfurase family protein, partial [Thermodesulfobacteriota bacterium]